MAIRYRYAIEILDRQGEVTKTVHKGANLQVAVQILNQLLAQHGHKLARQDKHFEMRRFWKATGDVDWRKEW